MNALFAAPIEPLDESGDAGQPANAPAGVLGQEETPQVRALALYETATRALAEIKTIDGAKDLRDKSAAAAYYARLANNRHLEVDALELRLRAERRLGEMLAATELNRGRASAGRTHLRSSETEPRESNPPPTLADLGIDKKLSAEAQRLARLDETDFEDRLGRFRDQAFRDGGRISTRIIRDVDKKTRRAVREEVLGRQIRELPDKKFGVVLADPPWRFEPRSRETGLDRAADNHYPTMTTGDIVNMNVMPLAADDCVLFLWATAPMLPQAITTMISWGFAYRSHIVWRKAEQASAHGRSSGLVLGTGYWFRSGHELLLLGTRGSPPAPAAGAQWPSVIDAAPRRHSQKPDRFYELIEEYFPTLPRIELFSRAPRENWSAWGNEAETDR